MQSHQWKRWFISRIAGVEKMECYIIHFLINRTYITISNTAGENNDTGYIS